LTNVGSHKIYHEEFSVIAPVRWGVVGPGGIAARFGEAMRLVSCTARISGTEGWIDLPAMMHCPDAIVVGGPGAVERIDAKFEGDGLRFQIEEVHRCLDAGRTESSIMSLDESIAIAGTLDAIRAQLHLVYPGE
jgi:hypothetical protein